MTLSGFDVAVRLCSVLAGDESNIVSSKQEGEKTTHKDTRHGFIGFMFINKESKKQFC